MGNRFYVGICVLAVMALALFAFLLMKNAELYKSAYQTLWTMNCSVVFQNYESNIGTRFGDTIYQIYTLRRC